MSVKNKIHVNDELNETVYGKKYNVKGNTTEYELMETIDNISDDLLSNDCSSSSNQNFNNKNLNKMTKNKTNEDFKKDSSQKYEEKMGNKKGGKGKMNISVARIPQIYETCQPGINEENQGEFENESQSEKNILANLYAIVFIIIGIVIILHAHLREDHIVIKSFAFLKIHLLSSLKTLPMFSKLMKIVARTNSNIDIFLDSIIEKSVILRPYIEALRKTNTEMIILCIFSLLTFFTATFIIHIICHLLSFKNEKDISGKKVEVLVTNKMTMEEYEDNSFTFNELTKLHEDEAYICLKNKRAGKGVEPWNWQMRKTKKGEEIERDDKEYCSDIELSDMEDN